MKCGKVLFLITIISIGCYTISFANAYGKEANYIARNIVEISRIDSFLYKTDLRLDEKMCGAHSLIRYTNEDAITLLKKLLNDSIPEFQNVAIMPLINAGEFDLVFNKLKELIRQDEVEVRDIFYIYNTSGGFEQTKRLMYTKYRDQFVPYFMELCESDSISYEIKYYAANTLYYLGNEDVLRQICNTILTEIPGPETSERSYIEYTPEEQDNWHLRRRAQYSLKLLNDESR